MLSGADQEALDARPPRRLAAIIGKVAAATALLSGAALTFPTLMGSASAAGAWAPPASPTTSAPFNECPGVGHDTSCAILIVLNPDGTATINADSSQGAYDGNEDTLVGVLNNSGAAVSSINLTSTLDIFALDGDGVCSSTFSNTWEVGGSAVTNTCPYGSSAYEGPNTSYSNIAADKLSGTVNFTNGLANGANLFFSLENRLTGANFTVTKTGVLVITASSGTITQGSPPPPITPTFSGVTGGDTSTSLTSASTQPTCTTTATSASPPGTYPSTCSGAVDSSYSSITYVPGTITVLPRPATAAAGGSAPPAAAPATAPAPIAKATVVHTGQPWAGSRPYAMGLGATGLGLLGFGLVRRRRFRTALQK